MSAVEQIKKTGKVTRGQLGAVVQEIDGLKAQAMGLPDSRGAPSTRSCRTRLQPGPG